MVGSATLLKLCLISPLEKDERYGRDLPVNRSLLAKSRSEVMLNIAICYKAQKTVQIEIRGRVALIYHWVPLGKHLCKLL